MITSREPWVFSGDEPITRVYPTCSVCGVPQAFAGTRTEQLIVKFEALSSEQRELITRLVDLCASR